MSQLDTIELDLFKSVTLKQTQPVCKCLCVKALKIFDLWVTANYFCISRKPSCKAVKTKGGLTLQPV